MKKVFLYKKVFIKEEKIEFDGGLIAYVDGSYNIKTHEYGFGCVIIEEQKVIKEMYNSYISRENLKNLIFYIEFNNIDSLEEI